MFSADYFPPKNMNGNHNRLFYLAKGLQKNHDVIIVCPNNKYEYEKTEYKGIKIIKFPFKNTRVIGKSLMILNAHKYLKKILKKEHINMNMLWYNSGLAVNLSRNFNCLKVYDVMGIVSNELLAEKKAYPYLKSFLHKKLERTLYANSSIITTINNSHKKILSKRFHKKIYLLRDAVDYQTGINDLLYKKLKERYKNNFVLFFVGSFIRKRFEKNMDAFEPLIKNIPEIKIVIAGDGKYLDKYKKEFMKKNIQKNFDFLGRVSGADLNSYIKISDICFSDVFLDGFPYKIFEYMSMGKVSLVEETDGVKELLMDGKNCLLYKNSKDFEKKVMQILKNNKLKKEIEKNARIESNNHTWNVREKEFNKILNETGQSKR
jgi:glycosyltransferase involved in cell wall biosynthesis